MDTPIAIDGRQGEGGGQILRSALALSVATRRPVQIDHIRGGRRKPGLLRQHLTCIHALERIARAEVRGASLGSTSLRFTPTACEAVDLTLRVGTAGSTALVAQAVVPALLGASGPSTVTIEGGTHARGAPPFEFLAHALAPLLVRMGHGMDVTLEHAGYFPAGGGRVHLTVTPGAAPTPLVLETKGDRLGQAAHARVARVQAHVAERELKVVRAKLGWDAMDLHVVDDSPGRGPGNALVLEIRHAEVTGVFSAFGAREVPAERVARDACREAKAWLASEAPVDVWLADQLMLPLALGAGGRFRTCGLSPHARTNLDVLDAFLPGCATVSSLDGSDTRVEIRGRAPTS